MNRHNKKKQLALVRHTPTEVIEREAGALTIKWSNNLPDTAHPQAIALAALALLVMACERLEMDRVSMVKLAAEYINQGKRNEA